MNESPDEPPLDRSGIWDRINACASNLLSRAHSRHGHGSRNNTVLPVTNASIDHNDHLQLPAAAAASNVRQPSVQFEQQSKEKSKDSLNSAGTVPVDTQDGEKPPTLETKPSLLSSFFYSVKMILLSSWVNWLLVFVPVGIALGAVERSMGDSSPVSPTVVFAINAVAIIPLAWMLGYATECVASDLGDTVGALLNVTFGNAVELIIFIALVADEISIVQASLLGSILANLLLILGMCFLFGGLRFREQLYNSAVTQMSACLLSLSVISLLLPTAFHASFSTLTNADAAVVKVSRGTSVVLLLVYILYLLFQLKSHSYIYESTPQHMIDEESHPGVLADILNSSSSSDSSSDDDSDASSGSNTTVKRIRKALRKKRRRKSSSASKETMCAPSPPSFVRTGSSGSQVIDEVIRTPESVPAAIRNGQDVTLYGQEQSATGDVSNEVTTRDFEGTRLPSVSKRSARKSKQRIKHGKNRKMQEYRDQSSDEDNVPQAAPSVAPRLEELQTQPSASEYQRRSFNFRNLPYKPAISRVLTSSGLKPTQILQASPSVPAASGNDRPNLRRTSSLPDRLDQKALTTAIPSAQPLPHLVSKTRVVEHKDYSDEKPKLSRFTAIVLLLVSTGLVAACAEFLVNSIDYLVKTTGVSQAFIGLIILPIVGNAAEHVTAVTVASKNKMDLAIGVALGSSIQIALFVTPVIVLLGWILNTEMSLYFSLFETVSLFASAFIVNYLMLDGRTNYLEGALLISAYVIIAVAAFFYPSCEDTSSANGGTMNGTCR
ncbi:putative membrane bound cation transporter [Talaromyces proteolyticus]|uniref:Membrane bound cation transporter n=1 Tax=Talaromyces proteolyticus TaxID=1131652 RepID=A0AAD4KKT3_9EURO|nr:putative membrane bound cation transporter [Talaromyces proteolyticus]KAH8692438.1 putative membrane bound cation transporter [Talaromyces proteolyticus]